MQRRGQLWFIAQFVLFCAILVAPLVDRFDCPLWLRVLGLMTLAGGIFVTVLGYRTLGSSHSPWTNPIEGGHLVTTSIYRFVRHPIYTGWIVVALGWALFFSTLFGVGVAIAGFIFYDLKAREEEKWLIEKYSDYAAYQRQVRRFIPRLY